ncbi:MAG: hypothetical protein ACJAXJ_004444 [Colwellia sp.]|jgi:hypothetical protein
MILTYIYNPIHYDDLLYLWSDMKNIAITHTCRGLDRLLLDGGDGAWTVGVRSANKVEYVVSTQNLSLKRKGDDWGEATHAHDNVIMVGKVSEVVEVPTPEGKRSRYRFVFSEYCDNVNLPNMWFGGQFSVNYFNQDDPCLSSIDFDSLDFKPMPSHHELTKVISIDKAKIILAEHFDIHKDNLTITI